MRLRTSIQGSCIRVWLSGRTNYCWFLDESHLTISVDSTTNTLIATVWFAFNPTQAYFQTQHVYMGMNWATMQSSGDYHSIAAADQGGYAVAGIGGATLFSAIYGTGVTSYSGTTPQSGTAGAVDSHWTLGSQPAGAACTASTSAYIATTPPSVWASPANGAQWITPNANGNAACPAGVYVDEQAVNLTGFSNLAGASVSGWFSGDDYATLKVIHRVGGADTVMASIQSSAFYCVAYPSATAARCGMMPFSIPGSSFSADGNNVLRLEVNNGYGATGAYVEVDPVPPPPGTGSLSLSTSVSSVSLAAGGASVP